MLKEALRNFVTYQTSLYGGRGKKWVLVLHTSCVCYAEADLRAAAEMPEFYWIVPDNVRCELQLLCKESRFPNFQKNAKLILDKVQQSSVENFQLWDLEELYLPHEKSGRTRPLRVPGDICRYSMIFAFGNPLKEDEFLRRTPDWPGDYYILFIKTWNPNEVASIQRIKDVKGYPLIHPQAITPAKQEIRLNMRAIYYLESSGRMESVRASDLKQCKDMAGNYSHIYSVSSHPDWLLKIYRRGPLDEAFQKKLRSMTAYGQVGENVPALFPIALLTTADGTVVGYAMRKAQGVTLRQLMHDGWRERRAGGWFIDHELNVILHNLTLLLIELHSLGFIVNDLSFNNIIVDEQDQVYLVDCDSFQMRGYPGGQMTRYYRHPDIQGDLYANLRDPVYEYFAYAVLLQQCYMGLDNPLGKTEEYSNPGWDEVSFDPERNYSDSVLESWNQPEARNYRVGMFSELTFQEDLSFGAWLRIQEFFQG